MLSRFHKLKIVVLAVLASATIPAFAEDISPLMSATSLNDNTAITTEHQEATAWQLTDEEWQRYQQLMQGTSGRWYPTLNPPEVLGLNAVDEIELERFAKIVARQRYERVSRELKFQQAVTNAWRQLYPDLPAVKPFKVEEKISTPPTHESISHE